MVAKALTLEVTPVQAQKISLATNVGSLSLSLILRKAGDANIVANSRVKIELPPPPPPSDATVTIIRNLKGVDYKVMKEAHGRGS
jgi:Flp pilus assembly protein CpaB